MAYITNTRIILEELKAILEANKDTDFVSTGALEPLASEGNSAAVYISIESIALSPERLQSGTDGYDRNMFVSLYCNYDGSDDPLGVYDFADSVERSVLADSGIWTSIVDRELVALEFDNQQNAT